MSAFKPVFNEDSPFLGVTPSESDNKNLAGVNPLFLSVETLLKLGHPTSPIKAIRAHCIDCCGGNTSEVRKCTALGCHLWAFRMGKNVFHGRKGA